MEGVRGGCARAVVTVSGIKQGGGVEQGRVRVPEVNFSVLGKYCGEGGGGGERWDRRRRWGEVYTRQVLMGRSKCICKLNKLGVGGS